MSYNGYSFYKENQEDLDESIASSIFSPSNKMGDKLSHLDSKMSPKFHVKCDDLNKDKQRFDRKIFDGTLGPDSKPHDYKRPTIETESTAVLNEPVVSKPRVTDIKQTIRERNVEEYLSKDQAIGYFHNNITKEKQINEFLESFDIDQDEL